VYRNGSIVTHDHEPGIVFSLGMPESVSDIAVFRPLSERCPISVSLTIHSECESGTSAASAFYSEVARIALHRRLGVLYLGGSPQPRRLYAGLLPRFSARWHYCRVTSLSRRNI
jgi:hypothetical protein